MSIIIIVGNVHFNSYQWESILTLQPINNDDYALFNHILCLFWIIRLPALCHHDYLSQPSPHALAFITYHRTHLCHRLTGDFCRLKYSWAPRLDFIALKFLHSKNCGWWGKGQGEFIDSQKIICPQIFGFHFIELQ